MDATSLMYALIFGVVPAIVAPPLVWYLVKDGRARDRAWLELARRLGLERRARTWRVVRRICGVIDGCEVQIGLPAGRWPLTQIEVRPPVAAPRLGIAFRARWLPVELATQSTEVHTDDHAFDRDVVLHGDEAQVRAMLDAAARRTVLALLARDVWVEAGAWRYSFSDQRFDARVDAMVHLLVKTARALSVSPEAIPAKLAAQVEADPDPSVRAGCLALLARDFHDAPSAQQAGLTALGSLRTAQRLSAASLVGGEAAIPVLIDVVRAKQLEPAQRLEAFQLLVRDCPYARLGPALDSALRSGKPALVACAVAAVGRARDGSRLATLRELASAVDAEVAQAVAQALSQLQDPSTQPELLHLLERDELAVRQHAAVGLGRVGTVAAVEPLLRYTHGLLTDPTLKELAREAVGRIQERLGSVDAGRLALASGSDTAGALSVAEDDGRLALANTREGPKG